MVEYTDPKNRINENMSVNYNINPIPTLIVEKPTDENISLNFPSVDYVEKPSNNFTLSIDNIIADTDGFLDDEPTVNEVYVDTGIYGTKNYDWIISSKGDMIIDNEDTTFITDDGQEAFFYPNYEINYDDGIYVEFDYIKHTSDEDITNQKSIVIFDDYNSSEITNKQSWKFNTLGFNSSGKVKITIINDVITFYLNDVQKYTTTFSLDDDYRFGFIINDTILTYKNFTMYSLGKVLKVDENVEWTNENKVSGGSVLTFYDDGSNDNYYLLHPETSTIIQETYPFSYKTFKGLTSAGNGHIYIGSTSSYTDFDCGDTWEISYDILSCDSNVNFGSHNGISNYGIYASRLGIDDYERHQLKFVCDGETIKAYVDEEYVTEISYLSTGHSYLRVNPNGEGVSLDATDIKIFSQKPYITKDDNDITIKGINTNEEDVEFYPLINNTNLYLYDNNEIIFSFLSREDFDENQKIIFKDQNDKSVEYSFYELLPADLLQGKISIIILDGYIKFLLNESQVLLTEKFTLNNLYSVGFVLKGAYESNTPLIDMDIMNFTIQFPYNKWEDTGADLKYNTNTVANEITTEITHDITGTSFKSKTSTGKGYVIPTLNGVFETPYVLKGSSDFEIDYYYTDADNGNNSIFVSNRIGSQSHQIFLKDLELTEDCRIKVVVTNEFETVGSQDSNANVKVYLGEFGGDTFDDTPVYDKDISISIVRAGYYFGMRQMYRTPEFKFKNLKIKTYSYDYNVTVIARGYLNMGDEEIWSDSVTCTINTHNRKLLAKFADVSPNVKYLDFVLLFDDDRITRLEISKIMLSDGLEYNKYSEDTSKSALSDIWIHFNRNYFCNYYSSSASEPTGLSVIRPSYEPITLKTLPAPDKTDLDGKKAVTVLYPYLKNSKDYNKPDKVALEYLNSSNQTIKLIYNG